MEKQIAQLNRKFDRLFWEAGIFDSEILKQVGAETDVRSINEDVDVNDN